MRRRRLTTLPDRLLLAGVPSQYALASVEGVRVGYFFSRLCRARGHRPSRSWEHVLASATLKPLHFGEIGLASSSAPETDVWPNWMVLAANSASAHSQSAICLKPVLSPEGTAADGA